MLPAEIGYAVGTGTSGDVVEVVYREKSFSYSKPVRGAVEDAYRQVGEFLRILRKIPVIDGRTVSQCLLGYRQQSAGPVPVSAGN